jgi:hypothetical protein
VVAPDDDRGAQLAAAHHLVEAQAEAVALAVAQPADPRGQPLEGDPLARLADPASEPLVVRELVEDRAVSGGDVGRVAGQRDPAEGPLALAEERADVGGHEARIGERALEPAEARLGAQAVAVVEDLGARVEEPHHGGAVRGHRGARVPDVLVGRAAAQRLGLVACQAVRDVAVERIVGARLVGDDVGVEARGQQGGQDLGGVGAEPDAERAAIGPGGTAARDGVLEVVGHDVEVPCLHAPADVLGVDLHAERRPAVHRHGEGLRASHAAEAGGQGDRPGERAAVTAAGDLREALVGSLHDALGADVDPRPGGHLPVHREPELLEAAELVPRGPLGHEVRVGQEHARGPLVRPEDADGLARLDEERLVVREGPQGCGRSPRTPPRSARRVPCRRRRRCPGGARRRPGRGCS